MTAFSPSCTECVFPECWHFEHITTIYDSTLNSKVKASWGKPTRLQFGKILTCTVTTSLYSNSLLNLKVEVSYGQLRQAYKHSCHTSPNFRKKTENRPTLDEKAKISTNPSSFRYNFHRRVSSLSWIIFKNKQPSCLSQDSLNAMSSLVLHC